MCCCTISGRIQGSVFFATPSARPTVGDSGAYSVSSGQISRVRRTENIVRPNRETFRPNREWVRPFWPLSGNHQGTSEDFCALGRGDWHPFVTPAERGDIARSPPAEAKGGEVLRLTSQLRHPAAAMLCLLGGFAVLGGSRCSSICSSTPIRRGLKVTASSWRSRRWPTRAVCGPPAGGRL